MKYKVEGNQQPVSLFKINTINFINLTKLEKKLTKSKKKITFCQ